MSCRSLNITVALYEQGALLLGDTISENNSRVVLVARDLTTPPVGIGTGSGPGLREYVTVVDRPTAGNNSWLALAVSLCCSLSTRQGVMKSVVLPGSSCSWLEV